MKSEVGFLGGGMVARSLKVTSSTHIVVTAVSAGVALNGMVAIQALGMTAQIVLIAVVFASLAAGSWAISMDVFTRSSQAVASLRSIGASRGTISTAVISSVLVYGAGGSALGAAIGAALGAALVNPGAALASVITEVVAVVVASSAGIAAGVYAGGRAAWRS